jgi:ParB/RepB/Spo0J family partition protein
MAETNMTVAADEKEHIVPVISAAKLATPETPEIPVPPAPDIADDKTIAPSNIIEGMFGKEQTAARKAEKQATGQEKMEQKTPVSDEQALTKKERGGRPPKEKKPAKAQETERPEKAKRVPRLPKGPKEEKQVADAGGGISANSAVKEATSPPAPEPPEQPRDAIRHGQKETIVYIHHADLHPFKNHPFQVRDDDEMKSLIASVKERGVDQPALVRPRDGGGYEIVAGHRRQHASELAGYANVPCVIRNMSDDEAVLTMTESNFNQRAEILPSERAQALKMQLEAIKHQGAKNSELQTGEIGKRSNEIIADKNKMAVKQVQRYIALTNLVPDLLKLVDDKKIPFTPAVEMSYIKPKNQRYIAVAIDAQQSAPSLVQAQRMRELDQKGVLNGDVIDGIMLEEKKEEIRVIFNSKELGKYFGPEKSPSDMKDQILKLLDDWKGRQPELAKPSKKLEVEK